MTSECESNASGANKEPTNAADSVALSRSPSERRSRARLRRGWRRTRLLWKALSSFVLSLSAIASVILVAVLFLLELTRRAVVFEPISVPKELADNGFSPEVAAQRLRDAVNGIVTKAHAWTKGPEIALKGEVPEIVVPTVGISIDNIAELLRTFCT